MDQPNLTHTTGQRRWLPLLLTAAVAVAAGIGQTAWAQSAPPAPSASAPRGDGPPPPGMGPRGGGPRGEGPGMGMGPRPGMGPGPGGPGGPGGHAWGRGHGLDGRMLDVAKATPEQRQQIRAIMDAAHKDLKTQRDGGRGLRQQLQAALAAPTVDAAAVEKLRQQMQAQHEAASKRMTQAMVDAAKVLTPEQRKTLADYRDKRRALAERHAAERAALDGRPAPGGPGTPPPQR